MHWLHQFYVHEQPGTYKVLLACCASVPSSLEEALLDISRQCYNHESSHILNHNMAKLDNYSLPGICGLFVKSVTAYVPIPFTYNSTMAINKHIDSTGILLEARLIVPKPEIWIQVKLVLVQGF